MSLKKLEKIVKNIDADGIWAREILVDLAKEGYFSVLKTRTDLMMAIESIAKIAKVCGTTGFCAWCQCALIWYIINSKNQKLKNGLLKELYEGKILGGTALSNPMKAFAGIEKNRLKAKRVEGGFIIDGTLNWVSNIAAGGAFGAIALLENGEPVMGVVRCDEGVKISSHIKYAALEGSATKAISLRGYFMSDEDIIAVPDFILEQNPGLKSSVCEIYSYLLSITPGFILLQAGIASGIIESAINEIKRADLTHGHINRFLPVDFDGLSGQFDAILSRVRAASEAIERPDAMSILRLRLDASILTQNATAAAVLACGTKGYLEGAMAARVQREGNFVLIVTPSVKHLLKELGEVQEGRGVMAAWRAKIAANAGKTGDFAATASTDLSTKTAASDSAKTGAA